MQVENGASASDEGRLLAQILNSNSLLNMFMLAGLLPAHKSDVQSATEWTASVHTLHMSKPVM